MGRKIFISYKYADNDVYCESLLGEKTVRNYVDKLEEYFEKTDDIYKGESDGEDLSKLTEDVIWNKLKDRIYDSSLTIIMISPNMKELDKSEKDQWIPWEVSYSLSEYSRKNKNGDSIASKPNALLGIVLPDNNNDYSYFLQDNNCCKIKCRTLKTYKLFEILSKNMFNKKKKKSLECSNNSMVYGGFPSYIRAVKWKDFIKKAPKYIEQAYNIQKDIENYDVTKGVK